MDQLDRRTLLAGGTLLGGALIGGGAHAAPAGRRRSITPGQPWLDTAGRPIQAHAGAIITVGDTFYWYGENKEFTTGQSIESWGIRFYRSRDLYNWEDLGPLIPPDRTDPQSPLSPAIFPERPHILYNPRTRKFVCWIKIRGRGPQYRTVMVADRITGPYAMVERELRPAGMAAGDFDLIADPETGKAYMYFEHDHEEVVCIELTPDWTNVTATFTRHFPRKSPETREGLAAFRRRGRIYLASSGMTGYFPNPSEIAVADSYLGPFTLLGDLHPTDGSRSSFNSQISSVFRHPRKKDLYIAIADRWLPDLTGNAEFESGRMSAAVRSAITKVHLKPRPPFTDEERGALPRAAALARVNTSISRYVWLPIRFDGDHPTIVWRDEWRIEDFA